MQKNLILKFFKIIAEQQWPQLLLGDDGRQIPKAETKTLAELSLGCSLRFHSRNIWKFSRNLHLGYLKRLRGRIGTAQAGSCSTVPLAGKFFFSLAC